MHIQGSACCIICFCMLPMHHDDHNGKNLLQSRPALVNSSKAATALVAAAISGKTCFAMHTRLACTCSDVQNKPAWQNRLWATHTPSTCAHVRNLVFADSITIFSPIAMILIFSINLFALCLQYALTRAQRAGSLNTDDSWMYEDGHDEIVFTVDQPCQLLGVGLCGTEGAYTVELELLEVMQYCIHFTPA